MECLLFIIECNQYFSKYKALKPKYSSWYQMLKAIWVVHIIFFWNITLPCRKEGEAIDVPGHGVPLSSSASNQRADFVLYLRPLPVILDTGEFQTIFYVYNTWIRDLTISNENKFHSMAVPSFYCSFRLEYCMPSDKNTYTFSVVFFLWYYLDIKNSHLLVFTLCQGLY